MDKEAVIQSIRKLDGENASLVSIEMPIGRLDIDGSEYNRVRVTFQGYGDRQLQAGMLEDEKITEIKEDYNIAIRYQNDEWDFIPVQETVSLEQAIRVAEYFIENNALSPFSKWRGNIPDRP